MSKYFEEYERTTRGDGQQDRQENQAREKDRRALHSIGRTGQDTGAASRAER